MASITVQNLDGEMVSRLRTRAAEHGRSMEEEVWMILRQAVDLEPAPQNLVSFIRECFAPFGGVELELPPHEPMREPPDFS